MTPVGTDLKVCPYFAGGTNKGGGINYFVIYDSFRFNRAF